MRKLPVLVLTLFLFLSCKKGEVSRSSEVKDITPKGNYAMLIVESESCIYCKQLKKDLQQDERLRQATTGIDIYSILYESNAKVNYKLDGVSSISTEEELARRLKVSYFPQIFFYDKEGKVILHLPGYQPPEILACSVKFVKEEVYKIKSYMEYVRSQCG
ncbi:MAG: thioredoxin [Acidobacteria bacterium]|jgi:thioredoxin-related protein|nr:MAG: thioredoxin [Acidobacteriota bacterium]